MLLFKSAPWPRRLTWKRVRKAESLALPSPRPMKLEICCSTGSHADLYSSEVWEALI